MIAVLLLVFGAAAYAAVSALGWWEAGQRPVQDRLAEVRALSRAAEEEPDPLIAAAEARSRARQGGSLLQRARLPFRAGELGLLTTGAAALGLLLGLAVGHLPGAAVGLTLGIYLPRALARRSAARRLRAFNDELPDALSILGNSLRAGFSLLQGIDAVAQELGGPLSEEFQQMIRELRVGIPLEDAMQNLTGRVGSGDLDLVATAVLIQRQVGGNLASVLEQIADTIRERIRLQNEVRALTAQGRLSGLIIGLLPVGLGVLFTVIRPSYMLPLFHSGLGLGLLALAGVLQVTGALVIKRMVNVEL